MYSKGLHRAVGFRVGFCYARSERGPGSDPRFQRIAAMRFKMLTLYPTWGFAEVQRAASAANTAYLTQPMGPNATPGTLYGTNVSEKTLFSFSINGLVGSYPPLIPREAV
jgi:hypothetical protein